LELGEEAAFGLCFVGCFCTGIGRSGVEEPNLELMFDIHEVRRPPLPPLLSELFRGLSEGRFA